MKLSEQTLNILKNFSSISPNILFKNSKEIATMHQNDSIIAETVIEEKIPNFCIFDLNDFLAALSLFEQPELEFDKEGRFVTIGDGSKLIRFNAGDPSIPSFIYPKAKVNFPTPEVELTMSASDIASLKKVASVLKVSDVSFIGNKKNIKLLVSDRNNSGANIFERNLGKTNQNFDLTTKIENFKMLDNDYSVSFSSKLISRFSTKNLTYYLSLESDSTFGE